MGGERRKVGENEPDLERAPFRVAYSPCFDESTVRQGKGSAQVWLLLKELVTDSEAVDLCPELPSPIVCFSAHVRIPVLCPSSLIEYVTRPHPAPPSLCCLDQGTERWKGIRGECNEPEIRRGPGCLRIPVGRSRLIVVQDIGRPEGRRRDPFNSTVHPVCRHAPVVSERVRQPVEDEIGCISNVDLEFGLVERRVPARERLRRHVDERHHEFRTILTRFYICSEFAS